MYEPALPVVAAPPTPPGPPSGPGCTLPKDCLAGVASTLNWFLAPPAGSGQKPTTCTQAWHQAVAANAGPSSAHKRCPAYGGHTFAGNPYYTHCKEQIIAAATAAGTAHCDPDAVPPSSTACASLSPYDGAVWDIMTCVLLLATRYSLRATRARTSKRST